MYFILPFFLAGTFGLDPKPAPAKENIITTTRSHTDPKVTAAVNACKPTDVIKVGGAGNKVGSDTDLSS